MSVRGVLACAYPIGCLFLFQHKYSVIWSCSTTPPPQPTPPYPMHVT